MFRDEGAIDTRDRFYEWKELADKKKEKYAFGFDEPLFAFAGILRECEIKGDA
ncbi:MAG: hypothetical protein LC730_03775 [Acidobacteria bacterium]|nr:hypothetical protein [Acidobacteriota bacterium]MCA1608565.1 hypothetical protein [Acidobacteriota bacterium]